MANTFRNLYDAKNAYSSLITGLAVAIVVLGVDLLKDSFNNAPANILVIDVVSFTFLFLLLISCLFKWHNCCDLEDDLEIDSIRRKKKI